MKIQELLSDYNVPFSTEGKNISNGWLGLSCPDCNDTGTHLGWNLDGDFMTCWKCGGKRTVPTLAKLLHVSEQETRKIIKQYGGFSTTHTAKVIIQQKPFKMPSGTMPLTNTQKKYLSLRAFDPDYLEKEWNLFGTGPFSKLNEIDYKHRIIIPFYWNDKIVSFDSRDFTGKAINRYQACPKEFEKIPHKEILYGKQSGWVETGILVEGPTDVWRFGTKSFAVSGIKYTPEQVRVIAKSFKRIAICFDDDSQAKIQANKLVAELKFRGVDAFRVDIEGDPGSMKQEDADYLVKQLIK